MSGNKHRRRKDHFMTFITKCAAASESLQLGNNNSYVAPRSIATKGGNYYVPRYMTGWIDCKGC